MTENLSIEFVLVVVDDGDDNDDDDDDDEVSCIVVGRTRESFDRKGDRSGRVRLLPLEIEHKWTSVPWGIQACSVGVVPTSGQSRVSGTQ